MGKRPSQAGKELGIGERQAQRWAYECPEVRAMVDQLSAAATESVMHLLEQVSNSAVYGLHDVLKDPSTAASPRVAAARAILELRARYVDLYQTERRVTELERMMANDDKD